jgi:hypothetical protein
MPLRTKQHKRFVPKGTYPNFYLAKTSFMLGTLDDIKREKLFSIAVILT